MIATPTPDRPAQVATDADGAEPAALDALLSAWGGPQPKPRLLYLTPTGGNPTGVTMSGPRRAALYAVARAHGLLILEDDAYWHLTFGEVRLERLERQAESMASLRARPRACSRGGGA